MISSCHFKRAIKGDARWPLYLPWCHNVWISYVTWHFLLTGTNYEHKIVDLNRRRIWVKETTLSSHKMICPLCGKRAIAIIKWSSEHVQSPWNVSSSSDYTKPSCAKEAIPRCRKWSFPKGRRRSSIPPLVFLYPKSGGLEWRLEALSTHPLGGSSTDEG